jgi:hypothetical protein
MPAASTLVSTQIKRIIDQNLTAAGSRVLGGWKVGLA